MIHHHIGALQYLSAENIPAPHCFTTRKGGVSTGYLESLNLGTHRGDDMANVLENCRILGEAVGFSREQLVLSHQTHTDIVLAVDESHRGAGLTKDRLPECDALITNTPGVALAVFSADCTPILLYDPVTGAVGAVHAGWRGTAAQIAGKTVEAMARHYGCRPEDLQAAIGPNIAQCCFATDEDVPQALRQAYGNAVDSAIEKRGEKYYIDLKAVNALCLKNAGVQSIAISDHCTYCRQDLYWSHRRTGQLRGSQAGIIVRR